jgi:hypothetical protein
LLSRLRNRLPERRQIWLVFSAVVFIVFSWTIFHALYQVPSWLYYMTVPGVLALFAYVLGFALLESLLVTGFLAFYCFILPPRWLKDHFAAAGLLLALLLTLAVYLLRSGFAQFPKMALWQLLGIPLGLLLGLALVAPLLSWLLRRFPRLAGWLVAAGERLTIFSYFYVPLGILGWVLVLVRNLF